MKITVVGTTVPLLLRGRCSSRRSSLHNYRCHCEEDVLPDEAVSYDGEIASLAENAHSQ
jgi:hypothetical protein